MEQYISKSALVAEINKRIMDAPINHIGHQRVWAYNDVKDILNTLEVKEMDLENSVKGSIDYPLIGYDFPNIYPNYKELKFYCDKNGIKDGDRVKIIIMKDVIL